LPGHSTWQTAGCTGTSSSSAWWGWSGWLDEKRFDRPRNLMGLEIELNLADSPDCPA